MQRLFCLSLFLLLFTEPVAFASLCESYKRNDSKLYDEVCTDGSGKGYAEPSLSTSTFSDAFHVNAASLPIAPSPYGIEILGSALRGNSGDTAPAFALIKGFHRFGAGISTGADNTFYGNDVYQRVYGLPNVQTLSNREPALGHTTNLNLGTSVALIEASRYGPGLQLGFSARYNQITNTWGGGPGVIIDWGIFTFGGGVTRETVSNLLPRMDFTTIDASVRLGVLTVEYTVLQNIGGPTLSPIQILTGTISLSRFIISVAARTLNYESTGTVVQNQVGIQYLFSRHFSAGFVYNYIPGADTLGAQFFL